MTLHTIVLIKTQKQESARLDCEYCLYQDTITAADGGDEGEVQHLPGDSLLAREESLWNSINWIIKSNDWMETPRSRHWRPIIIVNNENIENHLFTLK